MFKRRFIAQKITAIKERMHGKSVMFFAVAIAMATVFLAFNRVNVSAQTGALPPQPAPNTTYQNSYMVGPFLTRNWLNDADITRMVSKMKQYNMNAVYAQNAVDNTFLNTVNSNGFKLIISPLLQLDDLGQTATQVYNATKGNPAVVGYSWMDEPGGNDAQGNNPDRDKLCSYVSSVKAAGGGNMALSAVLVGVDERRDMFMDCNLNALIIDPYPFTNQNQPGDFTMYGLGFGPGSTRNGFDISDFVGYIRYYSSMLTNNEPLYVILQTHGFTLPDYNLREPTPAELRAMQWMSLGEGATGIFYFHWTTEESSGWRGLEDNPALLAEVSNFSRRTMPYGNIWVNSNRDTTNPFTASPVAKENYVSTLKAADGTQYVVAVNRNVTTTRSFAITSGQQGILVDIETGNQYNLNQAISIPAGDGKVFKFVPNGTQTSSSSSSAPTCTLKSKGDANCDGVVNDADYGIWKIAYQSNPTNTAADFDNSGTVNILDYMLWLENTGGGLGTAQCVPASSSTSSSISSLPPVGQVLLADNFDSGTLTNRTPQTGPSGMTWKITMGQFALQSGKLVINQAPGYLQIPVSLPNDYVLDVDITIPSSYPTSGDWFSGVQMNTGDFSSGYANNGVLMRFLYQEASNEIEMWEYKNGQTNTSNSNLAMSFVNLRDFYRPGQTYHVTIYKVGNKYTTFLDGQPKIVLYTKQPLEDKGIALAIDDAALAGTKWDNLVVRTLSTSFTEPKPICGNYCCEPGEDSTVCGMDCAVYINAQQCTPGTSSSAPATPTPTLAAAPPSPTPAPIGGGTSAGVPGMGNPYSTTVENWWGGHWMNPNSSNYVATIQSPSRVVTVGPGKQFSTIQAAIDSLDNNGGTIQVFPGTYGPFKTSSKPGDRRNNVHIIGMGASRDDVIITGTSYIQTYYRMEDYSAFDECLDGGETDCIDAERNPARNFYIKNVTFDGQGATANIWVKRAYDVLFDNVRFTGNGYPPAGSGLHPGSLSGHMGVNNVWVRNSYFDGCSTYCVYLDGAHGSGVVNTISRSAGGSGHYLYLTNDDFTENVVPPYVSNKCQCKEYYQEVGSCVKPGTGTTQCITRDEERNAKYIVIYGNTFNGGKPDGVGVTGENVLVANNRFNGVFTHLAEINTRYSNAYPGLEYRFTNIRVVNNTADRVSTAYLYMNNNAQITNQTSEGGFYKDPVMGQYYVSGNSGGSVGAVTNGPIIGPNTSN